LPVITQSILTRGRLGEFKLLLDVMHHLPTVAAFKRAKQQLWTDFTRTRNCSLDGGEFADMRGADLSHHEGMVKVVDREVEFLALRPFASVCSVLLEIVWVVNRHELLQRESMNKNMEGPNLKCGSRR
jgi:hypothetical protein